MGLRPTKAVKVFCCYAIEDQPLLGALEKHLSDLVREGYITLWSKKAMDFGKDWASEIDQRIQSAQVILLLLSADFLHSNYCYSREMREILKQHQAGRSRVIPVMLRPVSYSNPDLSEIQTLPTNGKAITNWHNRDAAFVDVVEGIRRAIDTLPSEPAPVFEQENGNSEGMFFSELGVASPQHPVGQKPTKTKRRPSVKGTSPIKQSQLGLFDVQTDSQLLEPIREDTHQILRRKARELLNRDQPDQALKLLEGRSFEQVPSLQRWRIAALRGHCYFGLGMFTHAHEDFKDALHEKPTQVPKSQLSEETLLYLHAAETSRELGRLEEATLYYRTSLATMDSQAPIDFAAKAHWGLALTLLEEASEVPYTSGDHDSQQLLKEALSHAETARSLYQSIEEKLNAVSLMCEMALIEQALGYREKARTSLLELISTWKPVLHDSTVHPGVQQKQQKEVRNIISTALCYLADIERDDGHYDKALTLAQQAAEIARHGPLLRQAEAAMIQGKILEQWGTSNMHFPRKTAESVYREAVDLLISTEMVSARVQTHKLLGRYLLKVGKQKEGEEELNRADFLSLKYAEKKRTAYY